VKKTELKKKIDRLWKLSKKDLERILKDTSRLAKKGEDYIREMSKKGEKNLEVMLLNLQKERLYYELGKSLANLSKNKWSSSKKAEALADEWDYNSKNGKIPIGVIYQKPRPTLADNWPQLKKLKEKGVGWKGLD